MTKTTKEKLDEAYAQFLSEDFDTGDIVRAVANSPTNDATDIYKTMGPQAVNKELGLSSDNPMGQGLVDGAINLTGGTLTVTRPEDMYDVDAQVRSQPGSNLTPSLADQNDADAAMNAQPNAFQGTAAGQNDADAQVDPNQKPSVVDDNVSKFNQFKQAIMDSAFMQQPWVKQFLATYDGAKDAVATHPGYAVAGVLGGIIGSYGIYKLIQMYKAYKQDSNDENPAVSESVNYKLSDCNLNVPLTETTASDYNTLKSLFSYYPHPGLQAIDTMGREAVSNGITNAANGLQKAATAGFRGANNIATSALDAVDAGKTAAMDAANAVNAYGATPIAGVAGVGALGAPTVAGLTAAGLGSAGLTYATGKKIMDAHDALVDAESMDKLSKAKLAYAQKYADDKQMAGDWHDAGNTNVPDSTVNSNDYHDAGNNIKTPDDAINKIKTEDGNGLLDSFKASSAYQIAVNAIHNITQHPGIATAAGLSVAALAGTLVYLAYKKWKAHKAANAQAIAQEATNTLINVAKVSKSLKACSENQKYATIKRINTMIQESSGYPFVKA